MWTHRKWGLGHPQLSTSDLRGAGSRVPLGNSPTPRTGHSSWQIHAIPSTWTSTQGEICFQNPWQRSGDAKSHLSFQRQCSILLSLTLVTPQWSDKRFLQNYIMAAKYEILNRKPNYFISRKKRDELQWGRNRQDSQKGTKELGSTCRKGAGSSLSPWSTGEGALGQAV